MAYTAVAPIAMSGTVPVSTASGVPVAETLRRPPSDAAQTTPKPDSIVVVDRPIWLESMAWSNAALGESAGEATDALLVGAVAGALPAAREAAAGVPDAAVLQAPASIAAMAARKRGRLLEEPLTERAAQPVPGRSSDGPSLAVRVMSVPPATEGHALRSPWPARTADAATLGPEHCRGQPGHLLKTDRATPVSRGAVDVIRSAACAGPSSSSTTTGASVPRRGSSWRTTGSTSSARPRTPRAPFGTRRGFSPTSSSWTSAC